MFPLEGSFPLETGKATAQLSETHELQMDIDGKTYYRSTSPPAITENRIQGSAVYHGDMNSAGRDIVVQHSHYYDAGCGTRRTDVLSALRSIRNMRGIHQAILSLALPWTGGWFFRWKNFILWLDPCGNIRILWGTGIPGAGKSVLMSIIISHLEARAWASSGQICVAYVYIRYSESADLTVQGVLEILVKQSVERHADCAAYAEQVYARHLCEDTQPTEEELLHLLGQFIKLKSLTFYFLDALDEAPERVQLVLVQKLSSLNARIFITSRPLKSVETSFGDTVHGFTIQTHNDDLDLRITQEISRSCHLRKLLSREDQSLTDEIVSSVKRKSAGMFLHASLHLEALSGCITVYDARQILDSFPEKIEDVYLRTWDRIQNQRPPQASLARAILLWVLTSPRSMRIEELVYAVATSPDTYQFQRDRLVDGVTLTDLCQGLITFEEESKLVRLVHYTARETLRQLLCDWFPNPHKHLVTVCITHLIECGMQCTTIASGEQFYKALEEDPLLAYASNTWAAHARQIIGDSAVNPPIIDFILNCRAFPVLIHTIHGRAIFDVLGPLHILTLYNISSAFFPSEAIGDPVTPTKIRQLSSLMIASLQGHYQLVQDLLRSKQIPINAVDVHGWSALMHSAAFGHDCIARLLLEQADIDVNLIVGNGPSALIAAAANGHEGVVILLVKDHRCEVNLVNIAGMSALIIAAANGHERIVTLLTYVAGIDINLVGEDGRSALFWAAVNGHQAVFKLLLSLSGIQVNLVAKDGVSALMAAAANGHEGIVTLLLGYPDVEVDLVNGIGMSALMFAAANGYHSIVKLLLNHPQIEVNRARSDGMTALMGAAINGHVGVVTLLLAYREIQVNLLREDGVSALMLALDFGHEAIACMLLKFPGIDILVQSKEGNHTAMSLAINYKLTRAIQRLEDLMNTKKPIVRPVESEVTSRIGIRRSSSDMLKTPTSPLMFLKSSTDNINNGDSAFPDTESDLGP